MLLGNALSNRNTNIAIKSVVFATKDPAPPLPPLQKNIILMYSSRIRKPRWSSGYTSRLSSGSPGFHSRSWLPHISHIYIVYQSYLSSSDGWGLKMASPFVGAVLRARTRTRVAVLEFHVSLYPTSVIPFFPLCVINV